MRRFSRRGQMARVNAPLVTVVLPVFNGAAFIARALASILQQSHRELEVLVIDNASTDDTPRILETFRRKDPRIRFLRNEANLGLPASLNRGLREARGEFVARMDGDDASHPRRLERQIAFLVAHPEIAICGTAICKLMGGRGYTQRFPASDAEIRATLLFHTAFAHPTVMWRRADFEQAGIRYDETFPATEDYELWSRALGPLRGANLPQALLDYYCHAEQMTASRYRQTIERTRKVHERVIRTLLPGVTPAQLDLHARVAIPHDPFDEGALDAAEGWLNTLRSANERARLYEPIALRRVLASRWAMLCSVSAGQGLRTYHRFLRSPFACGQRLSCRSARLLARCLLRR